MSTRQIDKRTYTTRTKSQSLKVQTLKLLYVTGFPTRRLKAYIESSPHMTWKYNNLWGGELNSSVRR